MLLMFLLLLLCAAQSECNFLCASPACSQCLDAPLLLVCIAAHLFRAPNETTASSSSVADAINARSPLASAHTLEPVLAADQILLQRDSFRRRGICFSLSRDCFWLAAHRTAAPLSVRPQPDKLADFLTERKARSAFIALPATQIGSANDTCWSPASMLANDQREEEEEEVRTHCLLSPTLFDVFSIQLQFTQTSTIILEIKVQPQGSLT